MAQATIGSLNVVLGMDAGDFNRAVKDVEGHLAKLSAKFGLIAGAAAAAGAALAQGLGNSLAGLAGMFRKAIDDADALDELAQKLGFTVEALSRMKYAAEISGVPLEAFTMGVTKLSVALAAMAGGETGTTAARTLTALGISATDAAGRLRDSEVVLVDLADKFASFRDGAGKTALAVNLFGESGAKLIPFLNAGRDGIKELTAEADRLGITLSSKTAGAAGKFNESLDKLAVLVNAGFKASIESALPTLQRLADWLLENDRAFKIVKAVVEGTARAIGALAAFFVSLGNDVMLATIQLKGFAAAASAVATLDFSAASASWAKMNRDLVEQSEKTKVAIDALLGRAGGNELDTSGMMAGIDKLTGGMNAGDGGEPPVVTSTRALAEASRAAAATQALHNAELARYNELLHQGTAIRNATLTPSEALAQKQAQLNMLLQRGAIDAETYGRAMAKAGAVATNAYASMAGSIVSDLGKVFENNKAVAVAAALINTYQAVTNAWANLPYPLNIAAAAASLAAGMAQVANIRSTSKSSSGAGGSSGGEGGGAGAVAAAPQQQQGMYVNLNGDNFSGDGVRNVRNLIERINEAQKDGVKLVVTHS
jgi:hypothetical protein